MLYIVFAPDTFPKPFYLSYYVPGQETQSSVVAATETSNTQSSIIPEGLPDIPSEGNVEGVSSVTAYLWQFVKPGQGITLDTGTKIVNLGGDPSSKKLIRTNVVLEFSPNDPIYFATPGPSVASGEGEGSTTTSLSTADQYSAEFLQELEVKMPLINDAIITLLSSKTFEDVYTSEGKDALRDEIMATVNEKLPEYHVIYVYFTEFVMQ